MEVIMVYLGNVAEVGFFLFKHFKYVPFIFEQYCKGITSPTTFDKINIYFDVHIDSEYWDAMFTLM